MTNINIKKLSFEVTDAMVDAAALKLFAWLHMHSYYTWVTLSEKARNDYRSQAKFALEAALAATGTEPTREQIVTDAMVAAAVDAYNDCDSYNTQEVNMRAAIEAALFRAEGKPDDVERLRGYAAEDWTRLRQREADLITQIADLQERLERKNPPVGYRYKTVCIFCDRQHGHDSECADKIAALAKSP